MKEYHEKIKNPETGQIEEKKLGPAYFEDSPEFKKEIAVSLDAARRAVRDIFGGAFSNQQTGRIDERAKSAAEELITELEIDLQGPLNRDSTIAIAAVESKLVLLDKEEEAGEHGVEEAGEDVGQAVVALQDVRDERKEYERAREILFSVNPHLTRLYTREDILDWARLIKENTARELQKFRKEHPDKALSVRVGDVENRTQSFSRLLDSKAVDRDYDAILSHLESSKGMARERIRELLLEYAAANKGADARKKMIGLEETISQYDQMERILEEERRSQRRPGIRK